MIVHQCISDGFQVAIIDSREIGTGSTSATTSMLQYETDVPLYKLIEIVGAEAAVMNYQACAKAIDQLGKISKSIQSDCVFL